jgi:hypothetical protein
MHRRNRERAKNADDAMIFSKAENVFNGLGPKIPCFPHCVSDRGWVGGVMVRDVISWDVYVGHLDMPLENGSYIMN